MIHFTLVNLKKSREEIFNYQTVTVKLAEEESQWQKKMLWLFYVF